MALNVPVEGTRKKSPEQPLPGKRVGAKDHVLTGLSACGVAGPVCFSAAMIVAGLLYPGYNQLTQASSELGSRDAPLAAAAVMNYGGVLVSGLCMIAFACGLYRGVRRSRWLLAGAILFGLFGLACLSGSFFSMDPGGLPWLNVMHGLVYVIANVALTLALLLLCVAFARDPRFRPYRWYTLITPFVMGLLYPVAALLPAGVPERFSDLVIFVWIEVIALRLLRLALRREPAPDAIRTGQTTNTAILEEPIPGGMINAPPDDQGQDEAGFPPWEGYQEPYDRSRNTVRAAVFGGLSGGIFFFGLAAAILSGHFWPVFLVALALASLVGPLGSANRQAIYGGVQGCVFLLGLAVLALTGWWWPGILVVLGIAAILGTGNGFLALGQVAIPSVVVDRYYSALRNSDYAQAYRFLDGSLMASLTESQFTAMAEQCDATEGAMSRYTIAPDVATTTTPLPGEPFPEVRFTRNPAEHVVVTALRASGRVYTAHLRVRKVGQEWKITAFDRI